jgi:N-acetylglucosamine-6-phosphate deacetylase
MIRQADVPLTDAIRMMTTVPARIMNIDRQKGSLAPGKDGDVVIFDEDINIHTTITGGKVIYQKPY